MHRKVLQIRQLSSLRCDGWYVGCFPLSRVTPGATCKFNIRLSFCLLACLISIATHSLELEVKCWDFKQYQANVLADSLPAVIPASSICCQVARGVCETTKPCLWITTALERVSTVHKCYS